MKEPRILHAFETHRCDTTQQIQDTNPIITFTDGHHVEDGPDNGHEEDGAEVVEEEPVRHEVARVQDDRRQHVQEERVRRQSRRDLHR